MPKMKTKKCLTKRFKATGTGKILRRMCNKSHRMVSFTGKRVRQLRRTKIVTGKFAAKILRGMQVRVLGRGRLRSADGGEAQRKPRAVRRIQELAAQNAFRAMSN